VARPAEEQWEMVRSEAWKNKRKRLAKRFQPKRTKVQPQTYLNKVFGRIDDRQDRRAFVSTPLEQPR
jgi:hypothetical protein